jgi:hypothetical protein
MLRWTALYLAAVSKVGVAAIRVKVLPLSGTLDQAAIARALGRYKKHVNRNCSFIECFNERHQEPRLRHSGGYDISRGLFPILHFATGKA